MIGHFLDKHSEPTEYSAINDAVFNYVAYNLGWKAFSETMEGSTWQVKIEVLIKHLDQEMDFVMITDRMDEILNIL